MFIAACHFAACRVNDAALLYLIYKTSKTISTPGMQQAYCLHMWLCLAPILLLDYIPVLPLNHLPLLDELKCIYTTCIFIMGPSVMWDQTWRPFWAQHAARIDGWVAEGRSRAKAAGQAVAQRALTVLSKNSASLLSQALTWMAQSHTPLIPATVLPDSSPSLQAAAASLQLLAAAEAAMAEAAAPLDVDVGIPAAPVVDTQLSDGTPVEVLSQFNNLIARFCHV
jgi:hypothetical protein